MRAAAHRAHVMFRMASWKLAPRRPDAELTNDVLRADEQQRRLRDLARPGVAAVRANWRPFVLLQAAALAGVVSYYQVGAVREVLADVAAFRERAGYAFAGVAAAVAGAVLPEVAKAVTQRGWRPGERAGEVSFLLVFFFLNGLLVDGFYRLLGVLFGTGTDPGTAIVKMLVDMLSSRPSSPCRWSR